jgi:hypothetical protein
MSSPTKPSVPRNTGPISGYNYRLVGRTWAQVTVNLDWSRLTVQAAEPGPEVLFRPSVVVSVVSEGDRPSLRCEVATGASETRAVTLTLGAAATLDQSPPAAPTTTIDLDDRSGKLWCKLTADDKLLVLSDREGAPRVLVTALGEGQGRLDIDGELGIRGKSMFLLRVLDGDGAPMAAQLAV